jgi:DNA-binding PadR family transcriptional regulator
MLLALSKRERHGYALKREILNKVPDQDLIEESEERPDSHLDDERRRYYRIYPLGWRSRRRHRDRRRSAGAAGARRGPQQSPTGGPINALQLGAILIAFGAVSYFLSTRFRSQPS